MLSICRETRAEAKKHYLLILQRAIPRSIIYFDLKHDILAASPFNIVETRHEGYESTTTHSFQGFGRRAQLLAQLVCKDWTKLQKIQSLVMGHANWNSSIEFGHSMPGKEGFRKGMCMGMSFPNLKHLILVNANPKYDTARVENILSTEEGKETCRNGIIEMYQEEEKRFPNRSTPEILIYDWDNPEAPVFASSESFLTITEYRY